MAEKVQSVKSFLQMQIQEHEVISYLICFITLKKFWTTNFYYKGSDSIDRR